MCNVADVHTVHGTQSPLSLPKEKKNPLSFAGTICESVTWKEQGFRSKEEHITYISHSTGGWRIEEASVIPSHSKALYWWAGMVSRSMSTKATQCRFPQTRSFLNQTSDTDLMRV